MFCMLITIICTRGSESPLIGLSFCVSPRCDWRPRLDSCFETITCQGWNSIQTLVEFHTVLQCISMNFKIHFYYCWLISSWYSQHKTLFTRNCPLNPAFTHVRLNLLYDANSVTRNPSTRINEGFTPPEELTTARIGTKCKQGETMRELFDRDQHIQNTLWRKA